MPADQLPPPEAPRVLRLPGNPIIRPHMDGRMGDNINGPSLIRVPEWVAGALGRYHLYFGHHDGAYIRLAYADQLAGPWRMHTPGVLPLAASGFAGHLASPDVHVDERERRIRLYFHGSDTATGRGGEQTSRLALSTDGLHFQVRRETLGVPYWRVFRHAGMHYALGMPGRLYRSADGLTGFEAGPSLFTSAMRHSAVAVDGDRLAVYYTNAGDCPERILLATIDMSRPWTEWRPTAPVTVLAPETAYEGADLPLEPSRRGIVEGAVRQLRDPAIFREAGRTWLLYCVAGESGIAIAELEASAAAADER